MLWIVTKSDERVEHVLLPAAEAAVRAVVTSPSAQSEEAAIEALRFVREHDHWLACDCRIEGGRRPLIAPCRLPHGAGYTLRVLSGAGRTGHTESCIFFRADRQRRAESAWQRAARSRPSGMFAVLSESADNEKLGEWAQSGSAAGAARRRVSALSRLLLQLVERGGLNRADSDKQGWEIAAWMKVLKAAADGLDVARGQPLADLLFTSRIDWERRRVHARIRAAAADWPGGSVAQGFLCCLVGKVEGKELPATGKFEALPVERGITRPIIGRTPVHGPYLFMGAVGKAGPHKGYRCIQAYAQPIVAGQWPVPVDSGYERQAFGTLRYTVATLQRRFPAAQFHLTKPVFEQETAAGPCLPDFLVHARRGDDQAMFVIEVMGFDRPSYLQGKEITHPRMKVLGPLLLMDGGKFADGGVKQEGQQVTRAIEDLLHQRWGVN